MPGEIFVPSLGRAFEHNELMDRWMLIPSAPTATFLRPREEFVVGAVLWVPPWNLDVQASAPLQGDFVLRVGKRSYLYPKSVLYRMSQSHLPAEFDVMKFVRSALPADEAHPPEEASDVWIRLVIFLENCLKLPQVGMQLSIPITLDETDELRVDNVNGGKFFIGGLLVRPPVRERD